MTQRKDFHSQYTFNLPKKILIIGVLIAVAYSSLFYSFLVCFRELFRVFAFMMGIEKLIILTQKEILFHNFFLAFIASLTGFAIGSEFLIRFLKLPRYMTYSVLVDQNGLQWTFNYWLVKLAVLFGLLSIGIPLLDFINFYDELFLIFVLAMIVLFFNQWTKARLFFKGKVTKLMITIGCIQIAFSLILSLLPIVDYEGLNLSLSKQTAEYYCKYELPSSTIAYGISRKHIAFPLYLGFSKSYPDSVTLASYWHGGIKLMTVADLPEWVSENRAKLDEMEYGQMTTELYVDKGIKMKHVKMLFMSLRKMDARRLYLMTNKNGLGMPFGLRPLCEQIHQADSSYAPPNFDCSHIMENRNKNRFSLELINNQIFFEGQLIGQEILDSLKANIKKFNGDLALELLIDDNSNYERFILLYDYIRKVYMQIWLERSRKKFGLSLSAKDFAPENFDPELSKKINDVRFEYPVNLVAWSDEEIEYFKLKPQK